MSICTKSMRNFTQAMKIKNQCPSCREHSGTANITPYVEIQKVSSVIQRILNIRNSKKSFYV